MIKNLDIQLLRTFVSVAKNHSLTQTAQRINLTQPAISQQLARLEKSVGLTLFLPGSRKRTLTPAGMRLAEHANNLIRMHDHISIEILHHNLEGSVTIGVPDLYATYLMPEILTEFGRAFPSININLRCALSVTLMEEISRGEIDLALITKMPNITGGEKIRSEQLIWVTNPKLDAHKLRPLPLAMLPPGNYYRDVTLASLKEANIKWVETTYSESISGLHASVLAGLSVTVLAGCTLSSAYKTLAEAQGLPSLPTVDLMLYRNKENNSPSVKHLANFIHEKLGDQ